MTLALVGTVSAATDKSLIPAIKAIGGYTSDQTTANWDLWDGILLGLQVNSDNTDHQCYKSFGVFKVDVDKMPDYLNAISMPVDAGSNTAIDAITTEKWYQPGTYFKLLKRSQEIGSVFLDLYE
jgi:hypothetical protein